jgi:two-component system, NarL family, response regulator
MENKIRLLIADDTPIAREGLRRLLADAKEIVIVGEASTIYEVLGLAAQLIPDIILLDLKWHGDETAGIAAIEYLRQNAPQSKVIAMTVYDQLIPRARAAGCSLALTKDFTQDELLAHIHGVYQAKSLPSGLGQTSAEQPLIEPLSARELEVLQLMAEGLTDREISDRLIITEHTAKNHVANILGKLGASNRTQAVVSAVRKGILDLTASGRQDRKL